MKRILIPLVSAVILAAFFGWWLSPGEVVKRRTKSLMNTLTIGEGSGAATRHAGNFSLERLIAERLALETPVYEEASGEYDRTQITSGFSAMAGQAKFTKFRVEEFHSITFAGEEALVSATVEAVVALQEYRPLDGLYEVEFVWTHGDDGWRLSRMKWSGR